MNTDAMIEMNDDDHRYEPAGAPLEVALLNFLIDNGVPVHEKILESQKNNELKLKSSFCSLKKTMTVVYRLD